MGLVDEVVRIGADVVALGNARWCVEQMPMAATPSSARIPSG